jgi:hypothetical protein
LSLSEQETIESELLSQNANARKYESVYKKGDIVVVSPKIHAYNIEPALRILRINDRTYEQAINYKQEWKREFTWSRIQTPSFYDYEYEINIQIDSISGTKELFVDAKEILKFPYFVYIISKIPTTITIGIDADEMMAYYYIDGEVDPDVEEKRAQFEIEIKDELKSLMIDLARSRYYFDVVTLPQAIIDKLDSEDMGDWIVAKDYAEISPYLKDKYED